MTGEAWPGSWSAVHGEGIVSLFDRDKSAERMPWGLIEGWIEDPDGLELRLVEVPPDHPLRRRVD